MKKKKPSLNCLKYRTHETLYLATTPHWKEWANKQSLKHVLLHQFSHPNAVVNKLSKIQQNIKQQQPEQQQYLHTNIHIKKSRFHHSAPSDLFPSPALKHLSKGRVDATGVCYVYCCKGCNRIQTTAGLGLTNLGTSKSQGIKKYVLDFLPAAKGCLSLGMRCMRCI